MTGRRPEDDPPHGGPGRRPELPTALRSVGIGLYVHVPFCRHRCGYCAFNTVADTDPTRHARFVDAAITELHLAARSLPPGTRIDTMYLGGGTPTLLAHHELVRLVEAATSLFGQPAELTVEANPETIDPPRLAGLARMGATRLSMGMQSLRTHVLAVLEREHDPRRPLWLVEAAHAAGIPSVGIDLIMGTPGESRADWAATLEAVIESGVDHVSAYGLMVEPGTRLAARVRRGDLPTPDEDVIASRWLTTDHRLRAAGYRNYELSNWARPGHECGHNRRYWTGGDWWGVGPGAHSHLADAGGAAAMRWWNVADPEQYAARLADRRSPMGGSEQLNPDQRRLEALLCGLRLPEGVPWSLVTGASATRLGSLRDAGLINDHATMLGRLALTPRGRLLSGAIAADLA